MSKEILYPAGEAWRKLRLAHGLQTAVYLYGATGFGKTAMVKHFLQDQPALWLSCREDPDQLLEQLRTAAEHQHAVLDDLQYLDDEEVRQAILELIGEKGCWVVLIGRMPTPDWLLPRLTSMDLAVIREEDLSLSVEEIDQIARARGLTLSQDELAFLRTSTDGNAMAVAMTLEHVGKDTGLGESLRKRMTELFGNYLERCVIDQWNVTLQTFLMELSTVDAFSLALAEAITGDDRAAQLLREAMNVGNFVFFKDDVYTIRQELRWTLRRRALQQLGRKHVNQCLYNAARYYELLDDVPKALELYDQCGEKQSIRALLIRNANRHPGAGWYHELRHRYLALTEDEVADSPVLMAALSILHSMMMDPEKSEAWYSRLKDYADRTRGAEHREAMGQLLYLDIALPHRGTVDLLNILRAAPSVLLRENASLPAFSMTNNQPSLMNGGKDFCEWSKRDRLLADTVGVLVERLMGVSGAGLTEAALGESLFEKGGDHYAVLEHLTRSQTQSESHGTIEMTFVAVGLQVRLCISLGNVELAVKLLDGICQRAAQEKAVRITANAEALRCRMNLMCSKTGEVARWMAAAPDETQEFSTIERYRYLTKIRCYLAQGSNLEALTLIERMAAYAECNKRTYIDMECGILGAMARKKLGMPWREELIRAMHRAAEYDFVRILSEEGAALLPLLQEVRHAFLGAYPNEKAWLARVMEETDRMARRYPGYRGDAVADLSDFSETALTILRLQASGANANDIAKQLGISPRTVKYHAAENYRKLGAKGMVEAVQIARSLNIL